MILFLDTNVILDVVLERAPWEGEAALLLAAIERRGLRAFVAGHTVTTAHCVITRARDRATASSAVSDLLRIVDVAPIDTTDLSHALVLPFSDFEDAVQAVGALKVGADYIVTRNERDFRDSSVPVVGPGAILPLLK